jgi:hypothetical protein
MATLDERILALEAKIDIYETQLQGATTEKEKDRLAGLITSAREVLKLLLVDKNVQQTAGTIIYCSTLPLNFISRTTVLNIFQFM